MTSSHSTSRSVRAVGIDLGTTYSLAAYVDQAGRPVAVANDLGEALTPSAILVGDDLLVGQLALDAATSMPEQFADCFKRDLGQGVFHRTVAGHRVPPEVLSALLLERLRQDVRRVVGPVRQAVVTAPAYFDELRRQATQEAARLAGWQVLDIINEPTAAALALQVLPLGKGGVGGGPDAGTSQPQHVLVYDLGGGTFDVSLLEIDAGTFRTLATDGDVELGGKDFDARLVDYVAEQFLAEHGLDPRTNPHDCVQLWQDAEQARHALTDQQQTILVCHHAGLRLRVELSRHLLEELTIDLLERTRHTADMVVRAAGLQWSNIDRLLCVGGATRMPMITAMLAHLSGQTPEQFLSPDLAVAQGAALYAHFLGQPKHSQSRPRCELINVNAHSLGVVGRPPGQPNLTSAVLIPRNTPIPARAVRTFQTREANQRSVAVPIVEGESQQPEYCLRLGKCVVRDLPPGLPKGTPVEVEYRYAANGCLTVQARLPTIGQAASVQIRRHRRRLRHSLLEWKAGLLGRPVALSEQQEEEQSSTRAVTDQRAEQIARLDELHIAIGRQAITSSLPAELESDHKTAVDAGIQVAAAEEAVAEVERRRGGVHGRSEALQLGIAWSQAQQTLRSVQAKEQFALLMLGRDCVAAGFCPPGAEELLREVRALEATRE